MIPSDKIAKLRGMAQNRCSPRNGARIPRSVDLLKVLFGDEKGRVADKPLRATVVPFSNDGIHSAVRTAQHGKRPWNKTWRATSMFRRIFRISGGR